MHIVNLDAPPSSSFRWSLISFSTICLVAIGIATIVIVHYFHATKTSKLVGAVEAFVQELEEKLSTIAVVIGSMASLFIFLRIPGTV